MSVNTLPSSCPCGAPVAPHMRTTSATTGPPRDGGAMETSRTFRVADCDRATRAYFADELGAFLAGVLPRFGERRLGGREILDALAPIAGLSMAVGRLGCLAGGCCFGKLCTGPTCLRLATDSLAWWNHFARGLIPQSAPATLPLHPVTLYLALAGLLAAATAFAATHRRWPAGAPTLSFLCVFCGLRLCIESFRETVLVAPIPFQTEIDSLLFLTSATSLIWLSVTAIRTGRDSLTADTRLRNRHGALRRL